MWPENASCIHERPRGRGKSRSAERAKAWGSVGAQSGEFGETEGPVGERLVELATEDAP